jgi:hypothetical protein
MAKSSTFSMLGNIAILLVSFVSTVGPSHAEGAGANCVTKPNSTAPQGTHWYFRADRETKRQCWFLGPNQVRRQQVVARVKLPLPRPISQPAEVVAGGNEVKVAAFMHWPELLQSANTDGREPTIIGNNDAYELTTTDLPSDISLLTAAAPLPTSGERLDYMLAAFGAALAFAAVVKLSIFKRSGMSAQKSSSPGIGFDLESLPEACSPLLRRRRRLTPSGVVHS